MIRPLSALFGIVLLATYVIAQAGPSRAFWQIWLQGAAGVAAFFTTALARPQATKPVRVVPPLVVGLALVALWLVALVSRAIGWVEWLDLGIGAAMLVLSGVEATRPSARRETSTPPLRKSA